MANSMSPEDRANALFNETPTPLRWVMGEDFCFETKARIVAQAIREAESSARAPLLAEIEKLRERVFLNEQVEQDLGERLAAARAKAFEEAARIMDSRYEAHKETGSANQAFEAHNAAEAIRARAKEAPRG